MVGDTVGDPFKDTSSVAMNPVIKFTTLFGLLAVELGVTLTAARAPGSAMPWPASSSSLSVGLHLAVVLRHADRDGDAPPAGAARDGARGKGEDRRGRWISSPTSSPARYSLDALIRWGGYVVLFAIVFIETGLLVGFFLPGDSLLITAGLVAAAGGLNIWWLNALLIVAAVVGDASGTP